METKWYFDLTVVKWLSSLVSWKQDVKQFLYQIATWTTKSRWYPTQDLLRLKSSICRAHGQMLADRPHFKLWHTSAASCLFAQMPEREMEQWYPVYSLSLKMRRWLGPTQQDKVAAWSALASLVGVCMIPFSYPLSLPEKKYARGSFAVDWSYAPKILCRFWNGLDWYLHYGGKLFQPNLQILLGVP